MGRRQDCRYADNLYSIGPKHVAARGTLVSTERLPEISENHGVVMQAWVQSERFGMPRLTETVPLRARLSNIDVVAQRMAAYSIGK
jgi:hypothetical protein